MSTSTYTVVGMTCGHCVNAVTEEVSAVPGVTAVDVDLASGGLTVTSDAPGRRRPPSAPPSRRPATRWPALSRHAMNDPTPADVELVIGGMTCASCAARVEKKLNRLDGVSRHGQLRDREGARPLRRRRHHRRPHRHGRADRLHRDPPQPRPEDERGRPRPLRRRLLVSRRADRAGRRAWRWSRRCSSTTGSGCPSLLATPVVVWGGAPFHRAAWTNLRHGAATMDTLVSLGTLAAYGWSLYALFLGGAGEPG